MEDPQPNIPEVNNSNNIPNNVEDEEARRRRAAEEAMEQMLLAQEAEEEAAAAAATSGEGDGGIHHDDEHVDDNDGHNDDDDGDNHLVEPLLMNGGGHDQYQHDHSYHNRRRTPSYIQTSFFAAFALIYYALRTRQQWYLALVYLSSSKWAYIVLGNALVAALIAVFQFFTNFFMNGLRLAEAEGLGDFFRWNVTETCLALTMFRSELNIQTGILFLILVLAKCLHWVADMREGHLRMTEEAVLVNPTTGRLGIRWPHFQLLLCLIFLQLFDVFAVIQCGYDIMNRGPSVSILFAFEGAILLVTVISSILLWHLHVVDGLMHYLHETMGPERAIHYWIHPWKDHKATLVFAVEVQAQAAKFLFYVLFFGIVMTYYGMPINLFRELYLSFQALKSRVVAFSKYRRLMASMNRFATPTEEELEEDNSCIICRDEMTVETSKKLPGCGHIFHKSCLREWLVQQQTCPTCRGDISTMEVRQQQQERADREREARQQEQQQEEGSPDQQEEQTSQQGEQPTHEVPGNGTGTHRSTPQGQLKSPPQQHNDPTVTNNTTGPRSAAIHSSSLENATSSNGESSILAAATTAGVSSSSTTTTRIREKRVRVKSPPPPPQHDSIYENDVFPAFYRVVQDQGAAVYNNGSSVSFVIREVPFGVIVLATKLAWRDCDGANRLMVLIPDGWILEDALERVVAVPSAGSY